MLSRNATDQKDIVGTTLPGASTSLCNAYRSRQCCPVETIRTRNLTQPQSAVLCISSDEKGCPYALPTISSILTKEQETRYRVAGQLDVRDAVKKNWEEANHVPSCSYGD